MKFLLSIFVCVSILSCANQPKVVQNYYFYQGSIQGTTFHITYQCEKDLAPQIDSLLQNFNKSLSNYDPKSVISKINYNESDTIDELFKEMFDKSYEVYQKSDGAFDISIAPVVNAWGFGWIKHAEKQIPDSAQIKELLKIVGMDKFKIVNGKVVKQFPESMLISNAIAQGLSVDYVSNYFKKLGLTNFLVEIGGEVYCLGVNKDGNQWRIGVDKPIEGSGYEDRENQIVINLSGKAISTSGNYRKFIENDGKKIGHSMNPKTGYNCENSLLSVSVVSDKCITCDAWSTAFMVSGLEKSFQILETSTDIEAYVIFIDENGKINTRMTPGFEKLISK